MRLILTIAVLEFVCKYVSGISSQCVDPSDNWHFRGKNIALNMPASQAPNSQQGFIEPADKAVDGNCDRDTDHQSCSHTDSNYNTAPTWTVELGQPYQITGVIIYNRDNPYGQDLRKRLAKFKVICNYDKQGSVTLYDDGIQQNPKFDDTIIQIELDGIHSCSSISVQIPQHVNNCFGFGCEYAYLTLCEVQVYAVGCSRPSITNGILSPNKNWYTQHESFTVTCLPGYTLSSPSSTLTCCSSQSFCGPIPTCRQVYCQVPEHPENGKYILPNNAINQTFPSGSEIHGECNIGYKQNIVNTLRECRNNGTLSGADLVCLPVTCQKPPGDINNGHYVYNNQTVFNGSSEVYNTTLFVVCNKGYKLTSQAGSIRCDQNGQWNGITHKCVRITCTRPDKFMNGHYASIESHNTYPYQYEITVVCDQGFKLVSATQIRICDDEGSWSGYSPICLEMKCPWPLNLPGGFYTPSGEEHSDNDLPVNITLVAACNDGYILNNASDIHVRCMEDGRWSPATIICFKKAANVDSNSEHLSQAMIVGVSVTAVIMLVVVVVVVTFVYHRRRASKKRAEEANYSSPTHNPSEGEYDELQETSYDQPTDSSTSVPSSNSQSRDITQDQEAHAYYNVL